MNTWRCVVASAVALMIAAPPLNGAEDLEGGITEIAQQLSARMAGAEITKIAIVEFPDINGFQSALGQFIAEELITQFSLVEIGKFDIVERRQLARVLAEQDLTDSSLFDAESIASIGKILGIEAIVTGSIADLGSGVKINARVISVETARVFAAASVKIPKDDIVTDLMRQSAGGAAAGAIGRPASRQVQSSGAAFDSPLLHIEVRSISRSADQKIVTLALDVTNVGSEDLLLAVDGGASCSQLIDDRGNSSYRQEVSGLTCISGWASSTESYSSLSKGSRATVTFVYAYQDKVSGSLFSFSAGLFRHLGEDKWQRLSIGISNIQMVE